MIGQTISHYKIIEKLGEGGMGVVYKALDLRLQRKVALKMLPASLASLTKSDRERFLLEAQATSSLDHPNICTVYEIDETPEGHAFIAMALYDGETLAQRIKRGALNHEEVLRIGAQVGLGLQAAHEQGIVHRDIKSSNVMLTNSGQVKIMDFGVAKYASAEGITQSGIRIGTLAYMSPEQAQGKSVDQRADIWSFGIVLYEMMTGMLPFDAAYEYGLLYAIIHDRPTELAQRQSAVHPEFQSIVDKCLEKEPQRRYGTAAQVVDHLLAVAALPPPAPGITGMKRIVQRGIRYVRLRWTATILLACFGITGLVLYFLLRSIDFQRDVIVYKINYQAPKAGRPVVSEAVLDYLLRDELEQSSYRKIVTEDEFARTYPGKTPAVEVVFDVRDNSRSADLRMRVQHASALPWIGGAADDTTYNLGDPSVLLKGITANIAEKVLRVAGIDQKKASTFTPSWDAFTKFYEGEQAWQKLDAPVARRVRWGQLMKENKGRINLDRGKVFLSDHFDAYMNTVTPNSRTLCGHWELDNQATGLFEPFRPLGAIDGKVLDATMAKNMSFAARWGSACGIAFNAKQFLHDHPQFEWMSGILKDRPTQPWTEFRAGER